MSDMFHHENNILKQNEPQTASESVTDTKHCQHPAQLRLHAAKTSLTSYYHAPTNVEESENTVDKDFTSKP